MSTDAESMTASSPRDAADYDDGHSFLLWHFVTEKAKTNPNRVAVTFDDRHFTWADLDARSDSLATYLTSLGVGVGSRVAHLDSNTVVALDLLFAVSKLGAVMIPLNWRLSTVELAVLFDGMQPAVVLTGQNFLTQAGDVASVTEGWTLCGYDEAALPWAACDRLKSYHRGAPGDTVLQLCTSGTTGKPRGVELTNLSLYPQINGIAPIWRFTAATVTLVAMPLFHVSGLGWLLASLSAGGRAILARHVVPHELLDLMESHAVTNFLLVPTVVRAISAVPGAGNRDWSALKVLAYGGAPMPADILRKAIDTFGCDTIEVYGMTETTGAFCGRETTSDPSSIGTGLNMPVGQMYPWMEVRIRDLETNVVIEEFEVTGEIEVSGPQLMSRYFNDPDATAAVLNGDWLRTGDAGYLKSDGHLYLAGRVKEMIISGGENIYPAEVENVLTQHEYVDEAALVGIPDEQWGELAVAFVVLNAEHDERSVLDQLEKFARARLANYKVPKQITVVSSLPKNTIGKILKRQILADLARSVQTSVQSESKGN